MKHSGIKKANSSDPILIVIVGPTASGKTNLAIKVAQHFGAEIISADSRQFYKEMEIGTAKPTPEELELVPHHFINSLSIQEPYDVAQFENDVLKKLNDLFSRQSIVVMAGGSGLFVKAVCEGLDDMPEHDVQIREKLISLHDQKGLEPLLEELAEHDPTYFNQVDQKNPHRIIRALEVIRATGRPFSSFRTSSPKKRDFKIIKIGLNPSRDMLYKRIDERMDHMINEGLFEEARKLYPFKGLKALQTVGYQEIFDFFDAKYDEAEAVRLLKRNSRRYAKRQLTWFKKDDKTHWFEVPEESAVISYLESSLNI